MKASIVIPAYNEEKLIEKILVTLKGQITSRKFEIIVGDGNSEDNTRKIAKRYANKIVIEKRRSAAWQRQAGAMAASGDIIVFVDADAEVQEDWLEKYCNEFENDKSLVMVYSGARFKDVSPISKIFTGFFFGLFMLFPSSGTR